MLGPGFEVKPCLDDSSVNEARRLVRQWASVIGWHPLHASPEVCLVYRDKIAVCVLVFHLKKNNELVLHTIARDKNSKNQGIGRQAIKWLRNYGLVKGATRILLKCPVDLESNHFYEAVGFTLMKTESSPKNNYRRLNVWVKNLL